MCTGLTGKFAQRHGRLIAGRRALQQSVFDPTCTLHVRPCSHDAARALEVALLTWPLWAASAAPAALAPHARRCAEAQVGGGAVFDAAWWMLEGVAHAHFSPNLNRGLDQGGLDQIGLPCESVTKRVGNTQTNIM